MSCFYIYGGFCLFIFSISNDREVEKSIQIFFLFVVAKKFLSNYFFKIFIIDFFVVFFYMKKKKLHIQRKFLKVFILFSKVHFE